MAEPHELPLVLHLGQQQVRPLRPRNFGGLYDPTRDVDGPDYPDAPHGASRQRHLCVTDGPELWGSPAVNQDFSASTRPGVVHVSRVGNSWLDQLHPATAPRG